jgi:tRNA1Val (adenine37-N6)-methyltransferase
VQDYAQKKKQKFEVIVSNPPFFLNSLKSPEEKKNLSKHNDYLSFDEFIAATDTLLTDTGCFGVILPVENAEKFEKLANNTLFYATKKTYIFPTRTKNANRILMLFERKPLVCEENNLVIRDNGYTDEYHLLVKEYLTIKN